MKRFIIIAAVILSACASDKPTGWRDTTDTGRQDANLRADIDVCEVEMRREHAVVPPGHQAGPGPALYDACMKARGWERVY